MLGLLILAESLAELNQIQATVILTGTFPRVAFE